MRMQRAWVYQEYGPKEVLKLEEIPVPAKLEDDQVLVQVRAAALNPIDSKRRQLAIFSSGLPAVPGCDLAGVVVGKGSSVTKFEVGDRVYGNIQDFNEPEKLKRQGTLAEYVAVEEKFLALKPNQLSFEEAASLPLALQTAIEGFKHAKFKEGDTLFVVGGAGGVGTLVIQLAKQHFGASKVVATCSTGKVEFVKSLGADMVVDYTTTKYKDIEEKFDFVYDTIGNSNHSIVVAKEDAPVVDITWPLSNPKVIYSSLTVTGENLEKLKSSLESGKIKAVIDPSGPYHFNNVISAFAYLETGRAKGKVVVSPFPAFG